jgi:RNA polymerase sigma-B factor
MTAVAGSALRAPVEIRSAEDCAAAGRLPWIEETGKVAPMDARVLSKQFFVRLRVLEEGTPEYQYARNTLIELNVSMVKFAAARFRHRREGMEELVQVGMIGMIKAIDRFDLSREVEFTTFAIPYITGEIKRFLRDTSWAVHVPRELQERRLSLAKATEALSQTQDHMPTTAELASYLDLSPGQVLQGVVAGNGYTAGSLDIPTGEAGDAPGAYSSYADRLGADDPGMENVENLEALKPLLDRLGARDRSILRMRFGAEMTQSEIGAELHLSQMHVSRLLARILKTLHAGMFTQ